MCGIVGFVGDKEAQTILIDGLKRLEYRGYDSAGIAVLNNNELQVVKTKGRLNDLENLLSNRMIVGGTGIGHTRWATHGEPSDRNAHPHSNNDGTISVVHNGIIENHLSLKKRLQKEGYEFKSETDTEVIVHLIDHYFKNDKNLLNAVISTTNELKGSYAIGVISEDYPDQVIVAKKDSPLVIGKGKDKNYMASDIPALIPYTREYYLLDDNEYAVIRKDSISIMDDKKNPIKKEIFKVDWDVKAAEKNGYKHFMLKEIHEQAKVIKETLSAKTLNETPFQLTEDDVRNVNRVIMIACGTAYYACLVGKYLMERIVKVPVSAEVASEFRYRDAAVDEHTLVVVISQSGETADTLAGLRIAKRKGAKVLAIVNVMSSSIAREADHVFYTMAGPEIAVASTKAYSCQLMALYLLVCYFATIKEKINADELSKLREELNLLPDKVEEIFDNYEEKIKKYAEKYKNSNNIFYIGRGLDYAVCKEGSLKLKEIAYIHSEPYAAGELKHGPIALVGNGTLVVGVLTQDSIVDKTISNLKEVKARGAEVVAIALEGNEKIKATADHVIYIPKAHWMFTSLLANIPQQLFAYYVSDALGHDVDKPRNLAKSVTVE